MERVLVLGKGGLRELLVEKIDEALMRKVVGTDAPRDYLEIVRGRFSDPFITVICNEEGRNFDLPLYAVVKLTKETLCGNCLIVSGYGFTHSSYGLSDPQIKLIREELEVLPDGISCDYTDVFDMGGFESEEQFLATVERIKESQPSLAAG